MKSRLIFICIICLLAITTEASAQSFLKKLKQKVNNATREVVNRAKDKATQEETPQTSSPRTLPFPKNHTALFAPLGYPCDPIWGTKPHKLSKPPYELEKQPDWMDSRPLEPEYDNASLVKAFKMLDECMKTGYINAVAPAGDGYANVRRELNARCDALEKMVESYKSVLEEYEQYYYDDGVNHGILLDNAKDQLCDALKNDHYKSVIRSSLAPLKEYLESEVLEYFEQHGGLENAHKAQFTVIEERDKGKVSTTSSGQSGTIISERTTGANVDIDGITYVIDLKQHSAFASKVVEMAVRDKDIVMPDYINYKGQQFPVKEMRGGLFSGMSIKSIKLPSTLTEIPSSAFQRTTISEIVIPASVKAISGNVFGECPNLKKVVFEGDRIDEIGGSFMGCTALQSITFPKYVGKIGEGMFERCSNLTSVTLPENLTEIPPFTFAYCAKLKNVTIPASVTNVGNCIFDGCGIVSLDLSHVISFDNLMTIGTCPNLKTVKLNAKLKEVFVQNVYLYFAQCPLLQLKFENGQYVYPAGLIFVETK